MTIKADVVSDNFLSEIKDKFIDGTHFMIVEVSVDICDPNKAEVTLKEVPGQKDRS